MITAIFIMNMNRIFSIVLHWFSFKGDHQDNGVLGSLFFVRLLLRRMNWIDEIDTLVRQCGSVDRDEEPSGDVRHSHEEQAGSEDVGQEPVGVSSFFRHQRSFRFV